MNGSTSLISEGTIVRGDFETSNSLIIAGTINGNVKVSGSLIIETSGVVTGTIEATNVDIKGSVKSDSVFSRQRCSIRAGANVIAKLIAAEFDVESGAQINCSFSNIQKVA